MAAPSLTGWAPIGGTAQSIARQISQSRSLRVERAVVAVVLLDLLEHDGGVVVASRRAQLAVFRVLRDRVGGRRDITGAQLPAHVQRLERLEAVGLGADPDALAHQRIQVDEHTVAQQIVHLVLADAVASGEPQQRGLLVGGVVVDVHVRVSLAPLAHHLEEVAKGLAFVGPVVRPQRREVVGGVEHAEEVFQPPLAAVGRPQRVALEVEEQIALVRLGQHHQRLRVGDLVRRLAVDARRDLQARLRGQRCDGARGQFGDAAVVVRELGRRW